MTFPYTNAKQPCPMRVSYLQGNVIVSLYGIKRRKSIPIAWPYATNTNSVDILYICWLLLILYLNVSHSMDHTWPKVQMQCTNQCAERANSGWFSVSEWATTHMTRACMHGEWWMVTEHIKAMMMQYRDDADGHNNIQIVIIAPHPSLSIFPYFNYSHQITSEMTHLHQK